ncbi:hypothetical protein Mal33_47590 [Rosistilla oblonga]|uniref:Uncharacterized protein n=1 Tax=Rosistilla oblonga TaxID=2527990 RepID=A0A518J067_9BACT|nr:hypothetical protein Mal33_47590 [Rosistilla oblonga]
MVAFRSAKVRSDSAFFRGAKGDQRAFPATQIRARSASECYHITRLRVVLVCRSPTIVAFRSAKVRSDSPHFRGAKGDQQAFPPTQIPARSASECYRITRLRVVLVCRSPTMVAFRSAKVRSDSSLFRGAKGDQRAFPVTQIRARSASECYRITRLRFVLVYSDSQPMVAFRSAKVRSARRAFAKRKATNEPSHCRQYQHEAQASDSRTTRLRFVLV